LLGYIPPVADFVKEYIDVILLGAVVVTLIPTVYHYVHSSVKAREAARNGVTPLSDEETTLKPEVFE
jgi:membrane-associated protein